MRIYIAFYLSREFATGDNLFKESFDFVVGCPLSKLSKANNMSGLVAIGQ